MDNIKKKKNEYEFEDTNFLFFSSIVNSMIDETANQLKIKIKVNLNDENCDLERMLLLKSMIS